MADLSLAPPLPPTPRLDWPALLDRLSYRAEILRRCARRARYLELVGRSPRSYPWFALMHQSMNGR